jgi:hypothetical protein
MLCSPAFEFVGDSDICNVCVSSRSAVEGVQRRAVRQICNPKSTCDDISFQPPTHTAVRSSPHGATLSPELQCCKFRG